MSIAPETPGSPAAGPDAGPPTRTRVPWWRHVLNGAALVAVLVVAGVVAKTAPSEAVWQGPIPVSGEVGEQLTGRNIQATVEQVRVAREVTASTGWTGETSGVWVVVDASVTSVVDDYGVSLRGARLQVGGTLFSASERPDLGTIEGAVLSTGIPNSGPLMFEVPDDVITSEAGTHAEVQLALDSDVRVDSMIVVPVDLTALPVEDEIETDAPVWGDE